MSEISNQHKTVLANLAAASKRAGRAPADLVAVSKVQPDGRIAAMLKTGQRIFGENRVQEAQTRWSETFADHRGEIELRLIGPLQTNKAADAVALFDVIETVDREKLVKALVKAVGEGEMPRLYVQVNTGEEPQKSGILPAELPAFLKTMRETYALEPEGLMCIPPAGEAASPHFWMLSNLAKDNGVEKLSMGMSEDYEIAAEMGATSVRVGSALFGQRNYD
jgi:pyridoxal phosphate enzyme (YggS family)